MTTENPSTQPSELARLVQLLAEKRDFCFGDLRALKNLQSVLGFARRLLIIEKHLADEPRTIKIPLMEEERIGKEIKEIFAQAGITCDVYERAHTIVTVPSVNASGISSLLATTLSYVEERLSEGDETPWLVG